MCDEINDVTPMQTPRQFAVEQALVKLREFMMKPVHFRAPLRFKRLNRSTCFKLASLKIKAAARSKINPLVPVCRAIYDTALLTPPLELSQPSSHHQISFR
jgi:hypothetical protein